MNYVCSQCGGEVMVVTLTSWPGKEKYTCEKCGSCKIVESSVFVQTVEMPLSAEWVKMAREGADSI